jgi:hypothetical protein
MDSMTHEERLKAMRQARFDKQDAAAGVEGAIITDAAGGRLQDGKSLATVNGGGIADRPSSKVLAPPGGKTSIMLG